MDQKIKDAVKELKEISSTLFQSGDLGLEDHGKITGDLGRAEQMLLAADEKYDAREENKEMEAPAEEPTTQGTSIRDQLNRGQLHA